MQDIPRVTPLPHASALPLGTYAVNVAASGPDLLSELPTKWELQDCARSILGDNKRLSACLRYPTGCGVMLWRSRSASDGGAFYTGLQTCGLLWLCPVCAAKIAMRRRSELEAAVSSARCGGFTVLIAAYTFAHGPRRALRDGIDAFGAAYRSLIQSRAYRALVAHYGTPITVRVLEVTHGLNGWHPHYHVLYMFPRRVNASELQAALSPLWIHAAGRQGLTATAARGLLVQDTYGAIGDYVAKYGHDAGSGYTWGVSDEMARSHSKRGRPRSGSTAFDLLRRHIDGDSAAGPLFQEFAAAMFRSKQLVWSDGARILLGLGAEQSDEAVALSIEDNADCLGALTADEWSMVRCHKQRGQLLAVANAGGWPMVQSFLLDMRSWL